ncbi:hypothetical protein C8J57DRAFT_1593441, partial [Mycena rebaudengoi]
LRLLSNAFTTTATVSNPPACCCPLAPTCSTNGQQHWYSLYTSSSTSMAHSLTLTIHPNSAPAHDLPSDCPCYHHNLHRLPRLSIPRTSPGRTAHILRLPTPLTFFCEPGCALLRTHAPVPLDDPPHRNLCPKSALTGTTVPSIALRSAAAVDSALHVQFGALCRRFGLESEAEG